MTQRDRTQSFGITLMEMMITLGLVVLVYTMITTVLVQVARFVKDGRKVAAERHLFLNEVETLRYQLRTLYYPPKEIGLIGERTPINGRDSLRFLTVTGRKYRGVVEVGYQVQTYFDEEGDQKIGLFYREFPFRREEMRTLDDHEEGRWSLLLDNAEMFSLEYSNTGQDWQKEWEGQTPPRLVRVRLQRSAPTQDRFVFDVTPGIGAGRW